MLGGGWEASAQRSGIVWSNQRPGVCETGWSTCRASLGGRRKKKKSFIVTFELIWTLKVPKHKLYPGRFFLIYLFIFSKRSVSCSG